MRDAFAGYGITKTAYRAISVDPTVMKSGRNMPREVHEIKKRRKLEKEEQRNQKERKN